MISVQVKKNCSFPAARAWELLSDFGNLSWAPGMGDVSVEGQGVGMIRKIALKDLPPAVELLDSLDPATMSFSYSVIEGNPMPVSDLRGEVRVHALTSDSCEIEWRAFASSASISDEDAHALLSRFYGGTLKVIEAYLSSSAPR